MRILWIGNYEDPDVLGSMITKGYKSTSSQVSQSNIIHGVEKVSGQVFDILSGSVLPEYPRYHDKIIREHRWSHRNGASDISVGYNNAKYINRISCQNAMVKAAKEWAKNCQDKDVIVLAYSMRSPIMASAAAIKKIIPSAKLYLIITDLPQYMDLAPSRIKKVLKRVDSLQQRKLIRIFDGYILYAEKMSEAIGIAKDDYMVMEGSISIDECQEPKIANTETEKTVIMYSGSVSLRYGIPELLDAFDLLDKDQYELWITGSGDAGSLVKERSEKNPSIKYYGFLESREQLLELQSKASMLISMRKPTEEASKYCFPSKIFEYMITGKPVLSFRIDGIPDAYYNYLIEMGSLDPESIKESIQKVGAMTRDERERLGAAGRAFVINNKNNVSQAKRICEFTGLV